MVICCSYFDLISDLCRLWYYIGIISNLYFNFNIVVIV